MPSRRSRLTHLSSSCHPQKVWVNCPYLPHHKGLEQPLIALSSLTRDVQLCALQLWAQEPHISCSLGLQSELKSHNKFLFLFLFLWCLNLTSDLTCCLAFAWWHWRATVLSVPGSKCCGTVPCRWAGQCCGCPGLPACLPLGNNSLLTVLLHY